MSFAGSLVAESGICITLRLLRIRIFMGQISSVTELLIAANRVLLELSAIDPKERTTLMSPAIRECLRVYCDLMAYHATGLLSEEDDQSLQRVMVRMKAHLTYLGEDV
jgi:hypothetical protein